MWSRIFSLWDYFSCKGERWQRWILYFNVKLQSIFLDDQILVLFIEFFHISLWIRNNWREGKAFLFCGTICDFLPSSGKNSLDTYLQIGLGPVAWPNFLSWHQAAVPHPQVLIWLGSWEWPSRLILIYFTHTSALHTHVGIHSSQLCKHNQN